MYVPLIEGRLKQRLLYEVLKHAPNEAVGIIYQELVFPLKNQAEEPEKNFEIDVADLKQLIEDHGIPLRSVFEHVHFWHSHPGGGVGPSRADMENKTPLKHHLVVALVDDDLVPTWY